MASWQCCAHFSVVASYFRAELQLAFLAFLHVKKVFGDYIQLSYKIEDTLFIFMAIRYIICNKSALYVLYFESLHT